jgi:ABC-type transport system substrate-binding protein
MNTQMKSSRRTFVTLAALMLLAATATGCGVGLPTQPSLEQATGDQRGANTLAAREGSDSIDFGDPDFSSGGFPSADPPAGETVIPTPTGSQAPNGLARGYHRNKKKNR